MCRPGDVGAYSVDNVEIRTTQSNGLYSQAYRNSRQMIDTAIAMEREACAQLAEEPYEFTSTEASSIADAIRARSNT